MKTIEPKDGSDSPRGSLSVADAVRRRQSIRAFLDEPVDAEELRDIVQLASRAPSNGNLQPWHVHVAIGQSLQQIKEEVAQRIAGGSSGDDGQDLPVYPPRLEEPYRGRRREAGRERYAALGFMDKDPAGLARLSQLNARCFGAPAALFVFLDDRMERHQWCDIGMFMQTVMLLALERGLDSCPQAFWTNWSGTVRTRLQVPENLVLAAAISLGRRDPNAPLNQYQTTRASAAAWLGVHD